MPFENFDCCLVEAVRELLIRTGSLQCVCVCVCVCLCVCFLANAGMQVDSTTKVSTLTDMHPCVHAHARAHTHTHIHALTHSRRTHDACARTHTTRTHTHTHTPWSTLPLLRRRCSRSCFGHLLSGMAVSGGRQRRGSAGPHRAGENGMGTEQSRLLGRSHRS